MSEQKVISKLAEFEPITLEEMDSVKLMDRTDTKFLFRIEQLPGILERAKEFYKVLDINGIRASKYETLYFDTENHDLFQRHQCGKMNRYKVRQRKYVESDLYFFEVKFKNNRERTVKERVKRKEFEFVVRGKAENLLHQISPLKSANLKPVLWVNYTRITLVNRLSKERLTLDINLEYRKDHKKKLLHKLVIAEVKQEKSSPSPFIRIVRQMGIREGGISKYCFGIIYMNENIRKNNFKPKLIKLNKLLAA